MAGTREVAGRQLSTLLPTEHGPGSGPEPGPVQGLVVESDDTNEVIGVREVIFMLDEHVLTTSAPPN